MGAVTFLMQELQLGAVPTDDRWDSISIDTRTALVTSVSMTLGSGGTVVPDSVPSSVSVLSISVVDDAP